MNALKIPHADIPNFTLELLQADLDKRLKESNGTVVAYSHETVQALISKVCELQSAAARTVRNLDKALSPQSIAATSKQAGREALVSSMTSIRNDIAASINVKESIQDEW